MNRFKLSALSAVIASVSGFSVSATAEGLALEEIVVTAQKRAESLQDVPISVSALSGDKLAEAGIQRFEEAATYIPNFSVQKETIGDRISIRGIGSGNQAGFEQSVGTFVDGIYRGRSVQSRFAFLDVGMVEVLRGPQGTLFGKNTIAGALNITSAKPTDEFEAEVNASYNVDFDETEYKAYVSGPLSDTVRGRVALMQREMDEGWGTNTFYDQDTPLTDEWAGRMSLEWDASDSTLVSFKYEHGDWDNEGQPWDIFKLGPLAGLAAAVPSLGLEDKLDHSIAHGNSDPVLDFGSNHKFEGDLDEYALNITHDLGGATLTAIVGYSEYQFDRKLDADYNPLSIARFDDREEFEQTSFELRIASDGDNEIDYIAGIYYQDADLFADGLSQVSVPDTYTLLAGGCLAGGGATVVAPGDPLTSIGGTLVANAGVPTTAGTANNCAQQAAVDSLGGVAAVPGVARYAFLEQNTESYAAFGQMTWNIKDDLRATLGLRYTSEEKEAKQSVSAPVYAAGNKTAPETDFARIVASTLFLEFTPHAYTEDDLSRDEESTTWSLNVQWDASDDAMVYASASSGFKAGGFNSFYMGQAALGGHNADDAEFEEEEVLAFEVGSKMSLLDGAAELNIAYFYTQFDDLQVSIFSGNTTFEVQNAAEATTQGIEIDGRWQATENLLLSGAFGWVDFEFDDFTNQACTATQFTAFRETAWANGANPMGALANNGACAAAGVNDLSGKSSAFTPEFSSTLSAVYTQDLSSFTLRYGLDVIWRDEMYVVDDLDPDSLSESVTKLNGSIRLTPESELWEIAVIGNNITDVDDDLVWTNDMPLVNGAQEATIAQPASYTIMGTLRF